VHEMRRLAAAATLLMCIAEVHRCGRQAGVCNTTGRRHVKQSKALGLQGGDVATEATGETLLVQVTILAREAGVCIDLDSVPVHSLVPHALQAATSVDDFMARLPEHDAEMSSRAKAAAAEVSSFAVAGGQATNASYVLNVPNKYLIFGYRIRDTGLTRNVAECCTHHLPGHCCSRWAATRACLGCRFGADTCSCPGPRSSARLSHSGHHPGVESKLILVSFGPEKSWLLDLEVSRDCFLRYERVTEHRSVPRVMRLHYLMCGTYCWLHIERTAFVSSGRRFQATGTKKIMTKFPEGYLQRLGKVFGSVRFGDPLLP
jgi:hypothetical protein